MTQQFFVKGKFPGMNEMIAAAKSGRGAGNAYSRMKSIFTAKVAGTARAAKITRVRRAFISLTWHEETKRRDPDNFVAAQKFVLDGLVNSGVLESDGWNHVTGLDHYWINEPGNPGVTVTIAEAE